MPNMIMNYEGLALEAYRCPAGKVTIGYGTTVYPDGTPVKIGDKITKERAEELLDEYYPAFSTADSYKKPKGSTYIFDLQHWVDCVLSFNTLQSNPETRLGNRF